MFKFTPSKEWLLKVAKLEGDADISSAYIEVNKVWLLTEMFLNNDSIDDLVQICREDDWRREVHGIPSIWD